MRRFAGSVNGGAKDAKEKTKNALINTNCPWKCCRRDAVMVANQHQHSIKKPLSSDHQNSMDFIGFIWRRVYIVQCTLYVRCTVSTAPRTILVLNTYWLFPHLYLDLCGCFSCVPWAHRRRGRAYGKLDMTLHLVRQSMLHAVEVRRDVIVIPACGKVKNAQLLFTDFALQLITLTPTHNYTNHSQQYRFVFR